MLGDPVYADWLDFTAELLDRPLVRFPHLEVGQQLAQTIPVTSLSWEWRDAEDQLGWEELVAAADHPDYHQALMTSHEPGTLDRHPLVHWFAVSGSVRPQTVGRLPAGVCSPRELGWLAEALRPFGYEHQLTIPYQISGVGYRAFVLNRSDEDFSDGDLLLTARLQPLLRGLHCQSQALMDAVADGVGPEQARAECGLTGTETAVLALLAEGRTMQGIARRLGNSPRTVNKHLEHIYRKLGVCDRLMAVQRATELGIHATTPRPTASALAPPDAPRNTV